MRSSQDIVNGLRKPSLFLIFTFLPGIRHPIRSPQKSQSINAIVVLPSEHQQLRRETQHERNGTFDRGTSCVAASEKGAWATQLVNTATVSTTCTRKAECLTSPVGSKLRGQPEEMHLGEAWLSLLVS